MENTRLRRVFFVICGYSLPRSLSGSACTSRVPRKDVSKVLDGLDSSSSFEGQEKASKEVFWQKALGVSSAHTSFDVSSLTESSFFTMLFWS
jgi:hypothetical protein